jgi:hypothetical protein
MGLDRFNNFKLFFSRHRSALSGFTSTLLPKNEQAKGLHESSELSAQSRTTQKCHPRRLRQVPLAFLGKFYLLDR